MATFISPGGNATSASLGASLERIARASAAAGFAMVMVEGLPEDGASDAQHGARSTWDRLEEYFGRLFVASASHPPVANAWQ